MDLRDKQVLIVGLGRSGLAASRICADQGARVTITDKRDANALRDTVAKLPAGVL